MKTTLNAPACLLALLCLTFSLFTCKQADVLPEATQEGKNTFGCLIDGKAYIPDGGGGFSGVRPIVGGFTGIQTNPYRVGISVFTFSRAKQYIALYLNDYRIGQHILNFDTQTLPTSITPKDYASYTSSEGDEYSTSSKYTGQITIIKADTSTGIVSGTFDFTGTTSTGKTVSITKGRFDVNARTQ